MKKFFKVFSLILLGSILVSGCGNKTANVDGNLNDLMDKVYSDISSDDLPRGLEKTELTEENIEYYIGTNDIKWKEAVVSESMMTSVAHSVVLIRMIDDATDKDIKDAVEKIKKNANPSKWICVEAENVFVESKGNLIILIMANKPAEQLKTNFLNLK